MWCTESMGFLLLFTRWDKFMARRKPAVTSAVQVDLSSLLFFTGVLLSVAALESAEARLTAPWDFVAPSATSHNAPWLAKITTDFHIHKRLQVLSRYSEFMNDSWLLLASMAMKTVNFRNFLYIGLNSSHARRLELALQHGHVPEITHEKRGCCKALNG